MEDKQIIELYWERSNEAIQKTEEKYGQYVSYIAHHILQDEAEAARCIRESYELLLETIPPHRPQNLKAYLCKITRNHALQMKYPAANPELDLFSVELVIYTFLKELEAEQRKLFVAHYWYMASVSEIAMQSKMSESKVDKTLLSLRQKLDGMLVEKNIHLQNEEDLLFAMTEIEDRYLAEAEPVQVKLENLVKISGDSNENEKLNRKDSMNVIWSRKSIPVIACIVISLVIGLVWPKNPAEQNPTESDKEPVNTEPVNTQKVDTVVNVEDLISISNNGIFHKDDVEQLKSTHPWNETMEIAALPVYKNHSYAHDGQEDIVEYMTESSLTAMVEDIATKLSMNILSMKFDKVRVGGVENKYAIFGVQATTDIGSIEIAATGKVTISFVDGVQLPSEYSMEDDTTVEQANNIVVPYLMERYKDIISVEYYNCDSYPTYDAEGNRTMHFRAIVDSGGASDVENILDYNFNQVEFYYNRGLGLTGFSYGDIRFATELLGYYPIVSLEEAKTLLQEGNYESDYFSFDQDGLVYEEEDVLGVELTYKTSEWENEYQPYYCFYILTAVKNTYAKCYVPAVEGVRVDVPEIEDLLELPEAVTIVNMSGYELLDGWIYYKDGKPYTLKNGDVVEATEQDTSEISFGKYGDVLGEYTENGTEWILYYDGKQIVNLSRLNIPQNGIGNHSFNAFYVEGQVVVVSILYPNSDSTRSIATIYLYSETEQSLTLIMDSVPLSGYSQPNGLNLLPGQRYPTMVNDAGEILMVDLLTGESVNTGILNDDVEVIYSVSDDYYGILYNTGEVVLIDKAGGYFVKRAKYQVNFTPDHMKYENNMLYLSSDYGNTVFIIREFE